MTSTLIITLTLQVVLGLIGSFIGSCIGVRVAKRRFDKEQKQTTKPRLQK